MFALLRIGAGLLVGGLVLLFHLMVITLGCVVYVYLLPGVIAMKRGYPRTDAVFIGCALLGWTVVGWVVALAFALTLPEQPADRLFATKP